MPRYRNDGHALRDAPLELDAPHAGQVNIDDDAGWLAVVGSQIGFGVGKRLDIEARYPQ